MAEWKDNYGVIPVEKDVEVFVQYYNGRIEENLAHNFYWENWDMASFDIKCWKLAKYEPMKTSPTSETNPKAVIGAASLPLSLFSPLGVAYGCLGKYNGMLKYGLNNYVGTNVVASIYVDAIKRHLDKWLSGEEVDEIDGVPHLGAILANVDILINAQAEGTLVDDRGLSTAYSKELKRLTPLIKSLQELHKGKNPKHYYNTEVEQ